MKIPEKYIPPSNPSSDSDSFENSLSIGPVFVVKGPNVIGFPTSKKFKLDNS